MGDISSAEFNQLKEAARQAAGNSWSPYSRFPVGAAVRSLNGRIFAGCNVENRSFGLTQCAERAALTAAVGAGCKPGGLDLLLIYTPGKQAHPPCGACRQVMQELLSPDATVYSCCDSGEIKTWKGNGYLPDPFTYDLAKPCPDSKPDE